MSAVEARTHNVRASGPRQDKAGKADAVGEAKRTQSEVAADEKGDDFDFATEAETNHEASENAKWAGGAGCEKGDAESGLAEEYSTNDAADKQTILRAWLRRGLGDSIGYLLEQQ